MERHEYEACDHEGRHGYTLRGEAEYEFCERCRRGPEAHAKVTRWECKVCPFTTTHEDAARGHISAAPPRGWLGEGERHSLSLVMDYE